MRGGLIAVVMIAVLLAFTPKPMPNWIVKSQSLPYAMEASDTIASLAPNAVRNAFRESMLELRRLVEAASDPGPANSVRALERERAASRKPRRSPKPNSKKRSFQSVDFRPRWNPDRLQRDLINSINAMLAWKHRDPLPHEMVASYIGNGAPMLMKRALPGLNEDEHLAALQFFLEYYREHMLDATVLYPGVREALDRLHGKGIPLAILTNKPVRFSVQLIAGLGLAGHFFQIYGGNSFEEKKPHPIGIERLIAESGADRERTVMVGDSAVDILTARAAQGAKPAACLGDFSRKLSPQRPRISSSTTCERWRRWCSKALRRHPMRSGASASYLVFAAVVAAPSSTVWATSFSLTSTAWITIRSPTFTSVF